MLLVCHVPPSPVPRGHCRGRHIDAIGFLQTLAPRPTALHCGPFPFPLLVNSLRREERPQTRSLPAAQRSFLSFFPSLTPPRLSVSALRSAVLLTQSLLVALVAVHLDSVPSCLFPFGPQIRPRLAHAHATILTNCRFLARLGSAGLCPHVTARRSGGPPRPHATAQELGTGARLLPLVHQLEVASAGRQPVTLRCGCVKRCSIVMQNKQLLSDSASPGFQSPIQAVIIKNNNKTYPLQAAGRKKYMMKISALVLRNTVAWTLQ